MSGLAMLLSAASGVTLLVSGYLYGARRGSAARSALLRELSRESAPADAVSVRSDIREELEAAMAPLLRKHDDTAALREMMSDVLRPIVERERLGRELSRVQDGHGLRELPRVLDAIAEKGGFSSVVLSDEMGLPLGANSNAINVDVLAGLASSLLMLVERAERTEAPKPLAFVVLDASQEQVVHRIFEVDAQRFTLTAVSRGIHVTPNALDAALGKLEKLLSTQSG